MGKSSAVAESSAGSLLPWLCGVSSVLPRGDTQLLDRDDRRCRRCSAAADRILAKGVSAGSSESGEGSWSCVSLQGRSLGHECSSPLRGLIRPPDAIAGVEAVKAEGHTWEAGRCGACLREPRPGTQVLRNAKRVRKTRTLPRPAAPRSRSAQ